MTRAIRGGPPPCVPPFLSINNPHGLASFLTRVTFNAHSLFHSCISPAILSLSLFLTISSYTSFLSLPLGVLSSFHNRHFSFLRPFPFLSDLGAFFCIHPLSLLPILSSLSFPVSPSLFLLSLSLSLLLLSISLYLSLSCSMLIGGVMEWKKREEKKCKQESSPMGSPIPKGYPHVSAPFFSFLLPSTPSFMHLDDDVHDSLYVSPISSSLHSGRVLCRIRGAFVSLEANHSAMIILSSFFSLSLSLSIPV